MPPLPACLPACLPAVASFLPRAEACPRTTPALAVDGTRGFQQSQKPPSITPTPPPAELLGRHTALVALPMCSTSRRSTDRVIRRRTASERSEGRRGGGRGRGGVAACGGTSGGRPGAPAHAYVDRQGGRRPSSNSCSNIVPGGGTKKPILPDVDDGFFNLTEAFERRVAGRLAAWHEWKGAPPPPAQKLRIPHFIDGLLRVGSHLWAGFAGGPRHECSTVLLPQPSEAWKRQQLLNRHGWHLFVSPSTIFACASILEGCSYINGSPQNTFVPGVIELAEEHKVYIGGDDFKSGQTKMKSVMVDFLVSAGIKPTSIVSYNHLGNNDGRNLSAPSQFRSKEISKSNVVDDMVDSNKMLYSEGEHPDHVVVIKYVPYVGDSKRAMDEYTSEIFMGGKNTIVMHNTCEDSLLASPLIFDLIIMAELCERIQVKKEGGKWEGFHAVLSLLSYMLKAPLVPPGTPVVNALFAQRQAIINVMRACAGLDPENHMLLEHRLASGVDARDAAQPPAKRVKA